MSEKLLTALFQERVGRFVGRVLLDGQTVSAHITNTGRCRELLYPGATVLLRPVADPSRKTKYDLAIVRRADGALVSIDSTVPNAVAAAYLPVSGLFSPTARILREKSFGSSRFDLYIEDGERRAYVEVKGVTLCEEEYRVARFPDAPTERGVKHLRELIECVRAGYEVVEKIFIKAGFSDNCRLIETQKAHWWCEDIVWNAINTETEKLGWK